MTDSNSSYKQYVLTTLSQYSNQLLGIVMSSVLAISTGFFNNFTTTIIAKITGTASSNATAVYLNNLVSIPSINLWSQLNGNGISGVQPNSDTGWTNFYIGFSSVPQLLATFDPVSMVGGNAASTAWYNANIGSIKMMLSLFSASSLPYCGFFVYNGSSYYLMLPDGMEYGWIAFIPSTTSIAKAGGNNNLSLALNGNSCQIMESNELVTVAPNGNYSQQTVNDFYTLNAVSTLGGGSVKAPQLVSFSYFNQFLGLTMTVYVSSGPDSVVVSFKDASGKGIGIQANKNIKFITN